MPWEYHSLKIAVKLQRLTWHPYEAGERAATRFVFLRSQPITRFYALFGEREAHHVTQQKRKTLLP